MGDASEKESERRTVSRRQFVAGAATAFVSAIVGGIVGSQAFPRTVTETVTREATKTLTSTATVSTTITSTTTKETTTTVEKEVTKEVPVKYPKVKKVITYDPSICSGCSVCVQACSLYHFGESNPDWSAITLKIDPLDAYFTEVKVCHQCLAPSCMAACPTGAIYIDENTGARCIDQEKCIGCGMCAKACPFNNKGEIIKYISKTNTYFKCDLCGGDPQCVRLCPMGALSFEEVK